MSANDFRPVPRRASLTIEAVDLTGHHDEPMPPRYHHGRARAKLDRAAWGATLTNVTIEPGNRINIALGD